SSMGCFPEQSGLVGSYRLRFWYFTSSSYCPILGHGDHMAPGYQVDDLLILQKKLAEAEAELESERQRKNKLDQRSRDLLDMAPVMVWMSGADAMCTYFNKSWLEFRGKTLEEELGNGWTEGIHPDDRDLCLETYLKAFSARQPFRMQYRMSRAGGDY